jgi:predicted PurR-regulated permease PerM
VTEAADPAAPPEPVPLAGYRLALVVGVAILAVIAVVGALYLARAFFVPLLIGILASYALGPLVDGLKTLRIPRAAGAALVLCSLVGATAWATLSLEEDATSMIAKLPDAARKVRQHVGEARATGPSTLQKITEAATELQGAADAASTAGEKKPARPSPPAAGIRPPEANAWVRDYMLAQSALLFTVVAQAPIVLLLTYFLLASGEHFRRKLVQLVGPSLSRKKDAVRILEEIDVQIQRCLFAILAANVLVGLGTWVAFAALGVEQAGAWGAAAAVFHSIPYLGPVLIAIASGVTAYLQFGTALPAFTVAGVLAPRGRGDRIDPHDMAAEPFRASECGGVIHRAALLRLAVGRLGTAARGAARRDREGNLRPRGSAQTRGGAPRSLTGAGGGRVRHRTDTDIAGD